jgi:hypothetical protein
MEHELRLALAQRFVECDLVVNVSQHRRNTVGNLGEFKQIGMTTGRERVPRDERSLFGEPE